MYMKHLKQSTLEKLQNHNKKKWTKTPSKKTYRNQIKQREITPTNH